MFFLFAFHFCDHFSNLQLPLFLTHFSIEDPFETHYDVAHVIKSAQMVYFRKELLVSSLYSLRIHQ